MPVIFTPEQRRAGGKASAEQVKKDRAELARLREWFAELSAKEALKQQAEVNATQPLDIVRVREKLDKLDELMNHAADDKAWDCLSRAYDRMFRVWCTLTKTPGPGNLKPSQPRQNTRKELPPPTVAQAQPSAAQGSAGPYQGTTGQG